jgi:NHL repeat
LYEEETMKQRSVWWSGCLLVLVATSCSFSRLSPLSDGGGDDGGTGTGESLDLELVAGDIGGPGNVDDTGAGARFNRPASVAVDRTGNVYIADPINSTIRKVTPAGEVTTLAGAVGLYGSQDGTGTAARFDSPAGVAVDGTGNVYVADTNNSTIRKITADGVVTTLAGTAGMIGGADGMGAVARFHFPAGVAVDGTGTVYVADRANATIRKIAAGNVTTLAGSAGQIGSADGTGAAARFSGPSSVTVDGGGNVYVADQDNATIRQITPAGVVTTLAGTAGMIGSANGTGAAARFNGPSSVSVDRSGNIYVADQNNQTVRKVTFAGVVTTLAGSPGVTGSADGPGSDARFNLPAGVAVDSIGNLYVADKDNHTLRKINSTGGVTTPAGAASRPGSIDGMGAAVRFSLPTSVAVDPAGNSYVADARNHTIRKITSAGVVTTLAGAAGVEGSANGTGGGARFSFPSGVTVDGAGNVYVADTDNHTIRKITAAGVVTTLAGTAGSVGGADGTGADARFDSPSGVAVDGTGNVYVADLNNHAIRKVTAAGVVTTLAGSAGRAGSADGTGADARFNFPSAVAVDGAGIVYVADENNKTIRKVTATGTVTTLAGAVNMLGSADGTGSAARFRSPVGVAVDRAGNVYVADILNSTIRKITPAGATTTFAGTAGATGILLGATPRLAFPRSVAVVGDDLVLCDANAVLRLRHRAPAP